MASAGFEPTNLGTKGQHATKCKWLSGSAEGNALLDLLINHVKILAPALP